MEVNLSGTVDPVIEISSAVWLYPTARLRSMVRRHWVSALERRLQSWSNWRQKHCPRG